MISSQDDRTLCVDVDHCQRVALPLCVDLDGTLINSNLLWECIVLLLKNNPFCLLLVPIWLLAGGRPNLKRQVARRSLLEPGNMPYNRELLEFLETEHKSGRQLVLATAADQQLAEGVAAHTGLFDRVHGTHDGKLERAHKSRLASYHIREPRIRVCGKLPFRHARLEVCKRRICCRFRSDCGPGCFRHRSAPLVSAQERRSQVLVSGRSYLSLEQEPADADSLAIGASARLASAAVNVAGSGAFWFVFLRRIHL